MSSNLIHRFHATGAGTPVNAYIVEGRAGTVVVDATLTVSDGRALRASLEKLDKPLLGVVITHAHPDHYGGLVELVRNLDVPVFATGGVDEVIRRDDPLKEQILRPMFGNEWAAQRAFPNQTVSDNNGLKYSFEIAPSRKEVLLKGLDDIGTSLQHVSSIDTDEKAHTETATMFEPVDVKYYA